MRYKENKGKCIEKERVYRGKIVGEAYREQASEACFANDATAASVACEVAPLSLH